MCHFTRQSHTEIRYGRVAIPCFSNRFTSHIRLGTSAWSLWCLFCVVLLVVVITITPQVGNAAAYVSGSVGTAPATVNLAVEGMSDWAAWDHPNVSTFKHKEMSLMYMIMTVAALEVFPCL